MAANPAVRFGAALASVIDRFGGRVVERESVASVGIAAASVIGNNPDRIALVMVNLSANPISVGLSQAVSAANGIVLGASGGALVLDVTEDFTLQAREWFAVAGGAASPLYLLEISRDVLVEG